MRSNRRPQSPNQMFSRIRSRLTYANVLATIALFLALSSTGMAKPIVNGAANVTASVKSALNIGKRAQHRKAR